MGKSAPLAEGSETAMPDWLELIYPRVSGFWKGKWDGSLGMLLAGPACTMSVVRMSMASLGSASSSPNNEGPLPPCCVLS